MGFAQPDVSVVIVSFNCKDMLCSCLDSLFKKTKGCSFEVIVSDNDSADDSIKMVRERFPSVGIVENNANIGFAAANNMAFKKCSGRYILLLNPDTLLESDAVGSMLYFMDNQSHVGICGPRLLNFDHSLQHSARNFPSISNQFAESLFLHKYFPRSKKCGELIKDNYFYYEGKMKYVDWVTGAALMIRREAFTDIGAMDERFFMYSEEKDWCFSAYRRGWPVAFYPGAEIVHLHGDSGINPQLFEMMIDSKLKFLYKNYPPYKAHAIAAIIRLNIAVRRAVYRSLLILPDETVDQGRWIKLKKISNKKPI